MSRVSIAARLLDGAVIGSVLDVGCRDGSLKDSLPDGTEYAGADLVQNSARTVKYVGDITTMDIPERYDTVVALDILEHLESPSSLFDRLTRLATKRLLVSLPNCYDLKSRARFVMGKPLGGKYLFTEHEQTDRHRWLMTREEIHSFYHLKSRKHAMALRIFDMTYGAAGNPTITSRLGRMAAAVLPKGMVTATVYGLFTHEHQ